MVCVEIREEGWGKARKRGRNRLKGRVQICFDWKYCLDGSRACGLKQPPLVLWRVFGAGRRLRGLEGPCSPFPPPEIRAGGAGWGRTGGPCPGAWDGSAAGGGGWGSWRAEPSQGPSASSVWVRSGWDDFLVMQF